MSLERDAIRGRQALRRQQIMELQVEVKSLARSIKEKLPTDGPEENMLVEEAAPLMARLVDRRLELRHIQAEFKEAERELA